MEVHSTNPQEPKKLAWRTILYVVVWLLLFAAVLTAIWVDIINPPINERIDQVMASNKDIETLCGNQPFDVQSNCQEKIRTAIYNVAGQALDDQRKRLWLILLSLVISVPFLGAVARMFMKTSEESKPLLIIICYVVILLLVLVVVSISIWDLPYDPIIAYVPVPILEWSFAGGILAVINRLASRRYSSIRRLYPWMVARPIIGLFMGGVIYFIALAGAILTEAPLTGNGQLPQNLWLNSIAFIAAFNDRFTEAVIGRVTSMFVPQQEEKSNDKEGSEKSR